MQPPILVATVQQVHEDCLRYDRDTHVADLEATADLAEPGLHAAGGIETEGGAAGENERIHRLHRHGRIEQCGFPSSGSAAKNGAGRNSRFLKDDRRHSRAEGEIGGVADGHTFDIGQEIERRTHSSK